MNTPVEELGKVSITVEKEFHSVEKEYERLTLVESQFDVVSDDVTYDKGTCFISRKDVPVNTELSDREYWVPIVSNVSFKNVIETIETINANKMNKDDSYTKEESDNRYLQEHQQLKTINGESIVGEGNIIIQGGEGGEGTVPEEIANNVSKLMAKNFPLTSAYVSHNAGTKEEGTEITPTATFSITREGSDVSAKASVSVTNGGQLSENKKSFTGTKLSTGTAEYAVNISEGGQTANLGKLTWNFSNYRYFGVLDSIPSNYVLAINALKSSSNTKGLSTSKSLGTKTNPISLSAGKYYLFAVKGNHTFIINNSTGGTVDTLATGTVDIAQENDVTKINTYSYVLVPASQSDWAFYIN